MLPAHLQPCSLQRVHQHHASLLPGHVVRGRCAAPSCLPAPSARPTRRSRRVQPPQAFFKLGGAQPGDSLPKDYDRNLPSFDKGRRAGIILHPTSLPGPYGIGELGDEAKKFIDWLSDAGMQCWQMLPMVPPDPMYYSPYSGTDANCGSPLIISIAELIKDGLLDMSDQPPVVPIADVDFPAVEAAKMPLLKKAAQRLLKEDRFQRMKGEYQKFRSDHPWIEDSALFDVARNLPELREMAWWDWPENLRLRQPAAIKEFSEKQKDSIDEFIAIQYFFEKQWTAIRVSQGRDALHACGTRRAACVRALWAARMHDANTRTLTSRGFCMRMQAPHAGASSTAHVACLSLPCNTPPHVEARATIGHACNHAFGVPVRMSCADNRLCGMEFSPPWPCTLYL